MVDNNLDKIKYGIGIHTIKGRGVVVVEGKMRLEGKDIYLIELKGLEGEVIDYSHPDACPQGRLPPVGTYNDRIIPVVKIPVSPSEERPNLLNNGYFIPAGKYSFTEDRE